MWVSMYQDGYGAGIYGQRFTKDNNKTGNVFRINTDTMYDQSRPCVGVMSDSSFVVVW